MTAFGQDVALELASEEEHAVLYEELVAAFEERDPEDEAEQEAA